MIARSGTWCRLLGRVHALPRPYRGEETLVCGSHGQKGSHPAVLPLFRFEKCTSLRSRVEAAVTLVMQGMFNENNFRSFCGSCRMLQNREGDPSFLRYLRSGLLGCEWPDTKGARGSSVNWIGVSFAFEWGSNISHLEIPKTMVIDVLKELGEMLFQSMVKGHSLVMLTSPEGWLGLFAGVLPRTSRESQRLKQTSEVVKKKQEDGRDKPQDTTVTRSNRADVGKHSPAKLPTRSGHERQPQLWLNKNTEVVGWVSPSSEL